MELIRISDRVSWVKGPANVGVISLEEGKVALIDSGCDEKFSMQLYEMLSDYRFKISYILNTHAHADHIGGNAFFQKKCDCKIMASYLEAPTIRQPLIQAAVLFSGAPITDLMNRFIMANPSNTETLPPNIIELDDLKIKILDLPGHSINQKGFLVDGIAFIADAIFGEDFFRKQRLPFNYDPNAQMQTLEKLKSVEAKKFIGGHFPPIENISPLVSKNLSHLRQSLDFMHKLLQKPTSQEKIVKAFLDNYGLKKNNWEYFLYRAVVNGYLSSLHKLGSVKYRVLDNLLVWYAI